MKKSLFAFTASAILFTQAAAAENVGVTSSADPRVTEAGIEMLRQGGSAADAAMAMMLALTLVEPQSSGIGGGGFLLYQDSAKGVLTTINGRETAPAAAKADRFVGPDGKPLAFLAAFQGGHSVGVPGNIQLMAQTHAKWGKLPWATVFKPAIRLSDKGFIVNKTLESRLQAYARLWPNFDEARAIYWRDGKPVTAGMTLKNPKLAATLKLLAKKGPDAFYTGTVANQIVQAVTSSKLSPGDMTMTDLAQYRAKEQQAVCAPYRVYVVCGMAPPSSGATTVLQILGTLQRFDLTATGKDSPKSWHLIGQAMQLAYADREKYLADDAFVDVPVAGLLNPEYIQEVAGTTHFTAIDANGNIANMTSTIEGPFGSQLVAGGFFLNNELTDFTFAPEKDGAPVANRVAGGKRPLSSMSPTMVFDRDGRAVLTLGSAGGKRIIMHVTKTLIGVLDFGLPLDQAIALPNIYFGGGQLEVEQDTSLAAMAEEISAFGQKVRVAELGSKVNGAQYLNGAWTGAADPRSEGTSATINAKGKVTIIRYRQEDKKHRPRHGWNFAGEHKWLLNSLTTLTASLIL
jgi:gamma-glutamyltranspeptidase/glutathione hydrolase